MSNYSLRPLSWLMVALFAVAGAAGIAAPLAGPASGHSERPVGTNAPTASAPADALQFFRDKDFQGDMTQVSEVSAKEPWNDHSFETKAKHFSSMRWNLPPGVLVTLFAGDNCTGKSLNVWGSGEIAELKKWKFNDDLSGWSWNGVGGVAAPSKAIKDGTTERPKYAKTAEAVPENSIECYRNRDAKGDMTAVEHITDQPANAYREMPKGTSSLTWNLPAGVVVTFAEKADGVGQSLAVWGSGQFDTFALWQMNDKLRYWTWQYLGDKP